MYNHEMVEKKWQKYWEDNNSFEALQSVNRLSEAA